MMKKVGYKKQIGIISIITIIGVVIASTVASENEILEDLVGYISLSILITLIPLYFTKEAVYKAWRKFAVIYLPIAIILIAIGDTSGGGGGLGGPSMDMDREIATFFFSGLFLFISFILITYKFLKLRGK